MRGVGHGWMQKHACGTRWRSDSPRRFLHPAAPSFGEESEAVLWGSERIRGQVQRGRWCVTTCYPGRSEGGDPGSIVCVSRTGTLHIKLLSGHMIP